MSDLYEKAIINAKNLREAAQRNALKGLVHEYAPVIKERVEKELFSEDLIADPDAPPAMEIPDEVDNDLMGLDEPSEFDLGTEPAGAPLDAFVSELPMASMDDAQIGDEPDDDDEIEIDLDGLTGDASPMDAGLAPGSQVEPAGDMFTEDDIMSLAEEFEVDTPPRKTGWMGRSRQDDIDHDDQTQAIDNNHEKKLDARKELTSGMEKPKNERVPVNSDDDLGESEEDKEYAQGPGFEELKREARMYKARANKLEKALEKVSEVYAEAAKKEVTLRTRLKEMTKISEDLFKQNSRLVYEAKALKDSSLNEQQREIVVDAIRTCDAESVKEEYEKALRIAEKGRRGRRPEPDFLTESHRPSFHALKPRRPKRRVDEGKSQIGLDIDRMRQIAGIRPSKEE